MTSEHKFIVLGTPRSGSSLLSAILANAGADFGMDRGLDWYRGSGAYEHAQIIAAYKHLKRAKLFSKVSDSLALREKKKLIRALKKLLSEVSFIKYPPLSEYLPWYFKEAGFEFRVIIIVRSFQEYAVSRVSKEGGDYDFLVREYLRVYKTGLINLEIYGGCIVCYEDLANEGTEWAAALGEVAGVSTEKLLAERDKLVKPTPLRNKLFSDFEQKEYDELYEVYRSRANIVFQPSSSKQHKK